jgi:hypothetical protein
MGRYFYKYENMERDIDSLGPLVLTDAALDQLTEQAREGCLLCVLGAFDAEDWD